MLHTRRKRLVALLACGVALFSLPMSRAAEEVKLTKEFAAELRQGEMVFDLTPFAEFSVARVLPNPHFQYSFALKHRTLPFEVRFATRHVPPVKGMQQSSMVESYVLASIMNMARKSADGPRMMEPRAFEPEAVKAEFKADWGAYTMIEPDPTFAKYHHGNVTVIYHDKTSTLGYSIVLYSGDPKMSEEMREVFREIYYAMRFRE